MVLLSSRAGVSSCSQTQRAAQVDPGSVLEAAWGTEAAGAGGSLGLEIAESGWCFLTKRLPALLQSSRVLLSTARCASSGALRVTADLKGYPRCLFF